LLKTVGPMFLEQQMKDVGLRLMDKDGNEIKSIKPAA